MKSTILKTTLLAVVALGMSAQAMSDEVIARYQTPWGGVVTETVQKNDENYTQAPECTNDQAMADHLQYALDQAAKWCNGNSGNQGSQHAFDACMEGKEAEAIAALHIRCRRS